MIVHLESNQSAFIGDSVTLPDVCIGCMSPVEVFVIGIKNLDIVREIFPVCLLPFRLL